MPFSDFLRRWILKPMFGVAVDPLFIPTSPVYLSLHTDSPGGTGLNEVAAGGYARLDLTGKMVEAVEGEFRVFSNSVELVFPVTASPVTVTHWGLWDADGHFLLYEALTEPETSAAGEGLKFPTGKLRTYLI